MMHDGWFYGFGTMHVFGGLVVALVHRGADQVRVLQVMRKRHILAFSPSPVSSRRSASALRGRVAAPRLRKGGWHPGA